MKQAPVINAVSQLIAAETPNSKNKHAYIHISCFVINLSLELDGFSPLRAYHLCACTHSLFFPNGIGDTSIEDLTCRMGHHQPAGRAVVCGQSRCSVLFHTSGRLGFRLARFAEVFATGLACTGCDISGRFGGTALIPLKLKYLSLPLAHYSAMFAVGKKLVNDDFPKIG